MSLIDAALKLWEEFVALFRKPETPQSPQPFSRVKGMIKERSDELGGGDWRDGRATWAGVLPILKNRTYYLECQPVSFADRRELRLSPPPTHTFKLSYFSWVDGQRVRTTVFFCYLNCAIPKSTLLDDWVATEIITTRVAQHIKIISVQSSVGGSEILKTEVVKRPGQLALVRVQGDGSIPSIVLLSRSKPEQVQAYWQGFLDAELERVRMEESERARR